MELTAQKKTMSHVEISKLTGKRLDTVKKSIKRLADKGIITFTPMAETSEMPNGGSKSVETYHVNERDSYIVVAQLSPEFTARLVDEWNKLRNIVKHNLIENPYTKEALKAKALFDSGFTLDQVKSLMFSDSKSNALELPPLPDTHMTIKMAGLTSWVEIDGKNVNIANKLVRISKALGKEILKAPHHKHGSVNAYHKDAFKFLVNE